MLNTKHTQTALELMPAMRAMFRALGLPADQVEDAVQDGFVFLVTYALPKWRGKGKARHYALTTVKRRWIDTVRLHGNSLNHRGNFPSESGDYGSDGSDFISDTGSARAEASTMLGQAMARISDADLRILAAVKRTGDWAAAARELGLSKATTGRARARIKAILDEE